MLVPPFLIYLILFNEAATAFPGCRCLDEEEAALVFPLHDWFDSFSISQKIQNCKAIFLK